MHPIVRVAILVSLAGVAPGTSRAADVTPEQARTLEEQLRGWFASMAGPGLPVASSPIQVTPAGDHYRLTMPPTGATMPVKGWPTVTASAKPAEGGRWTIEDMRVQTPATFTVNTPMPAKPGEKAGPPVPTTYTLNYATQEGGGTWDPTFATPSNFSTNSTGFRLTAEGGGNQQVTTIDRMTSAVTLRPVADNRVDFSLDAGGSGYSMRTVIGQTSSGQTLSGQPKAGQPKSGQAKPGAEAAASSAMDVTAQQVKVQLAMPGVSRERSAQVIPALMRLAPAPGAVPDPKVPPNPEGVRLLMQALQGFASGATMNEVLDGFTIKGQGFGFATKQLRLGLDTKADGGFLNSAMDVGLDGLALPGMGLDVFADLLPSRVALRPVVSHVPVKELLALLQTAGEDPNAKPPPAQVAALFSQGGLKAGLESFALDMGGASFAGKADIDLPSPNAASGTAQVTATNMDALLAKVQANPALAQAVPVIVLAKGIGRTEGGKMVWDMQFDSTKLLVNGVDLLKMGGK